MIFSGGHKLKPAMRLFVALGKFAASPTLLGGVGTAASLHDHAAALAREQPVQLEKLADALAADAAAHFEAARRELPEDAEILFSDMVRAARITPEKLLAANLQPSAIVDALLENLDCVEHRQPGMRAIFRQVAEPGFARLLKDPAISAEVLPQAMSEILMRQSQYAKTIEDLQNEVTTLSAGLHKVLDTEAAPNDLDRARLEALANRFDVPRPHVLTTDALFHILSGKAADLAQHEAALGTLTGSDALEALRAEAKDALDALDFPAAQAIFGRAHSARLESAAETGELMARNALMFNHTEEAYRHFGAIAESFRALDPIEAMKRRSAYAFELSDHGERYASVGMELAVEIMMPVLHVPELMDDPLLRARLLCQLADTVSSCLSADAGPLWETSFEKTVELYIAAETILVNEVDDPPTRAAVQNNLGNLAAGAAKAAPGVDRQLMRKNAIAAYQLAVEIYEVEGDLPNRANALTNLALVFGDSTEAMEPVRQEAVWRTAIKYLEEADKVYSDAGLLEDQALVMQNLSSQRASLSALVARDDAEDLLALAVRGFELVGEIFKELDHPMHMARAHLGLADAMARIGQLRGGDEGAVFLQSALKISSKVNAIISSGSQPALWATMCTDQGTWLEALVKLDGENATEHQTHAVAAYQAAQNIYDPAIAPDQHASCTDRLTEAQMRLENLTP